MSDLKVTIGQPITADWANRVVDRLPGQSSGISPLLYARLVLCRTTEEIAAAVIDEADTADSVYQSGVVDAYGLVNNGDGSFSPAMLPGEKIMVNASDNIIPSGTELWAIETIGGTLISTVWIC